MTVSSQARDPGSSLVQFLDTHLPERRQITAEWRTKLQTAPWAAGALDGNRQHLGQALEMRIGLDLADRPDYWHLLGYLPAKDCAALLAAAGFSVEQNPHLPDSGTTDPMLQSWQRTSRPDVADELALKACLRATSMDAVAHSMRFAAFSVQTQRSLLRFLERTSDSDPTLDCLTHLWAGYLHHGREPLRRLGERVLVAPELAPGFAVLDLVVGRTLVEIKTSADPDKFLDQWLDQVMGYLMIDRWNVLWMNQVAIYVGSRALLLSVSVDELLRTASRGALPELHTLREQFHEALCDDIEAGARGRLSKQYPIPPEAIVPR
ncbi:hypothetical protein [Kibdelosporangium aridum]|uniref:hypothetical protein n=1 Tax=Kibdelosporangium aridum TaxID=2030 RepID=UPI0035E68472